MLVGIAVECMRATGTLGALGRHCFLGRVAIKPSLARFVITSDVGLVEAWLFLIGFVRAGFSSSTNSCSGSMRRLTSIMNGYFHN